jgi:uncharacterized protein
VSEDLRWPGPLEEKPWFFDDAPPWAKKVYLKQLRKRIEPVPASWQRKERERAPLYIRFGDLPQAQKYGGRSLAYMGRKLDSPPLEGGVSVFRGYRDEADGAYVVDVANQAQASMWMLVVLEARDVYLATGREIAVGSDREPVLADVELEPLPPGTLVRASKYYGGFALLVEYLLSRDPLGTALTVASIPRQIRVGGRPSEAGPVAGLAAFAQAVLARAAIRDSPVHGERHWCRVAHAAARIVGETPGADPLVVLLFALVHDSQRVYEKFDAWHGWRAARLSRALLEGSGLVSDAQLEKLSYALEFHDEGLVSDDPTVGVCWDADRLCLWRVGVTPNPALLSTEAARRPEEITWARGLQGEAVSWYGACRRLGLTEPEPLAASLAEVLDGGPAGGENATLEDQVRDRLRRRGIEDEEYERAVRWLGLGSTLGPRP